MSLAAEKRMPSATVKIKDAVIWLRELMYMSKTALLRQANLADPARADHLTKADLLLYLFERRFDSTVKDPSIVIGPVRKSIRF